MKRKIVYGDITTVESGIIVHGCNAQGRMNSGVAKAIRNKYPDVFNTYQAGLKAVNVLNKTGLGCVFPYHYYNNTNELIIMNAITQEFYGAGIKQVSYKALHSCFIKIRSYVKTIYTNIGNLPSINYPLIGAGLGGGDWSIISEIINNCLEDLPNENILWIKEDDD